MLLGALALTATACSDATGSDGDDAGARVAGSDVSCPQPVAGPAAGEQASIDTADGERTYFVWTPDGYTGTEPAPLVLDFHGTGGEAHDHAVRVSGMVRDGLSRGYLVVAPQDGGGGVWGVPGYAAAPDDVTFVRDLVASLSQTYCVDPMRVHLTGHSLGAGIAHYLSCKLDMFAAIAPNGGVNLAPPCPERPSVSAVVWHGTNDVIISYGDEDATLVPPRPGENYVGQVPPVLDGMAARNACEPGRNDTEPVTGVTHRTYAGCEDGTAVEMYLIDGGGHSVPGGPQLTADDAERRGGQSQAINMAGVSLDFFDAHPRTRPPVTEPVATTSADW